MSHIRSERTRGPTLTINCPRCEAQRVAADTSTLVETANLILRHTTYWIQCSACGTRFVSGLPPETLAHLNVEETSAALSEPSSTVGKVIGIMAIMIGWIPFLGQGICLLSWWINRRQRGWRIVSQAMLVL